MGRFFCTLWIGLGLVSCGGSETTVRATASTVGVEVIAGTELERVDILDAAGERLATRRIRPPLHQVEVTLLEAAKAATIRAWIDGEPRDVAVLPASPEEGGDADEPPLDPESVSEILVFHDSVFPAEYSGKPDIARPGGRVTLPSPWWNRLLEKTSMGFRARDRYAPWSWQAVTLENRGEVAVDLVLRSRIMGPDDQPDPVFRPRMRDLDDGTGRVSVLLRVPARSLATGTLPLFVDEALLSSDPSGWGPWTREIEVFQLNQPEVLLSWRESLHVSRGSTAASLGMAALFPAVLGGLLLLLFRVPAWLRRARTSELMTIALFGSLGFLVQAAGEVVTVGMAAALGPFSGLLTGLVDDVFRYALLATLVTLIPRPGTVSLAIIVTALLGALTLGRVTPVDLLMLANRLFFLELFLWCFGITRSGVWREESALRRFLRLAGGFSLASVLSSAGLLILGVVLYRFFYATWYVVLILGLPAFLYVILACAFAVPFADSLRKVAP